MAAGNHFAQVGQHRTDRRERRGLDSDALASPFVAGEVVDPAAHLRLLVAGLEQFDGGQSIERVLQTTPAREDALPAVAPVAAGLVVQHLERGRADFVDAVDPSRDSEGHAVAQTDRDRLRTRERLLVAIQRPAERHLEADGFGCPVFDFRLEEQPHIVQEVLRLALENLRRGRRHLFVELRQPVLRVLQQPVGILQRRPTLLVADFAKEAPRRRRAARIRA